MSLTLVIVRHGESYSNLIDSDAIYVDKNTGLTMVGKTQAIKAGIKIKEMNKQFDAVYSSPYERAKETCYIALEAASMKGTKVVLNHCLVERNYYKLEGMSIRNNCDLLQALSYGELQKHIDNIQPNTIDLFDKIESYECEKARFRRFMREVRKKHKNGTILIFTHGLFEQAIYKFYIGERPELLENGGIRVIAVR